MPLTSVRFRTGIFILACEEGDHTENSEHYTKRRLDQACATERLVLPGRTHDFPKKLGFSFSRFPTLDCCHSVQVVRWDSSQLLSQSDTRTHRLLSSSFLGLPYRVLNICPEKELLRILWVSGHITLYVITLFAGAVSLSLTFNPMDHGFESVPATQSRVLESP